MGVCRECLQGYGLNFQNICEPLCGDGQIHGAEQCDDGNINPFDGCNGCMLDCFENCELCAGGVCFGCVRGYQLDIQSQLCEKPQLRTFEIYYPLHTAYDDSTFGLEMSCEASCQECYFGSCFKCQANYVLTAIFTCEKVFQHQMIEKESKCQDQNLIPFDGCHFGQFSCPVDCKTCVRGACIEKEGAYSLLNILYELNLKSQNTTRVVKYTNVTWAYEEGCNPQTSDCQQECVVFINQKCIRCKASFKLTVFKKCKPVTQPQEPYVENFQVDTCGDGEIERQLEVCDDGNSDPFDGCHLCEFQCQPECQVCTMGLCMQCVPDYELQSDNQCLLRCGGLVYFGIMTCPQLPSSNDAPVDNAFCQSNCQVCQNSQCLMCDASFELNQIDQECYLQVTQEPINYFDSVQLNDQVDCDLGCLTCTNSGCLICEKELVRNDINTQCDYQEPISKGLPIFSLFLESSNLEGIETNIVIQSIIQANNQRDSFCSLDCEICQYDTCLACRVDYENHLFSACTRIETSAAPLSRENTYCGDNVVQENEDCEGLTLIPFQGCFSCLNSCELEPQASHGSEFPEAIRILGYSKECMCPELYEATWPELEICTLKCHYSCLTCSEKIDPKACLTCAQENHRQLSDGKCVCSETYYDAGVPACKLVCHPSCETCIEAHLDYKCLTCSKLLNRQFVDGKCVCLLGYYDSSQPMCQPCQINCIRCTLATNCLMCSKGRHFVAGRCVCQTNLYEKQSNCQECLDLWTVEECQNIAGILSSNQLCDDSNHVSNDGCTNLKVDLGWSCVPNEVGTAVCYNCLDQACMKCRLYQSTHSCLECLSGYYLDSVSHGCRLCPQNCLRCTDAFSCVEKKEMPEGYQCDEKRGYYYKRNVGCYTKCGDLILADTEECDDGNALSFDGCSSLCSLEPGFSCNKFGCVENPKVRANLELKSTYSNKGFLLKLENARTVCENATLSVEGKLSSSYAYNISGKNSSLELSVCDVNITFFDDVQGYEIIHISVWAYAIQQHRALLEQGGEVFEIEMQLKREQFVSDQELAQAEQIKNAQSQLAVSLAFLGPASIILGGFDTFCKIIDLMTWINNFYFFNVEYPYNVQVFFKYALWGEIEIFKVPLELIQSKHEDYVPPKFQERSVAYILYFNAEQSIVLVLGSLMIFMTARSVLLLIKLIFFRKKAKKQRNLVLNLRIFAIKHQIETLQPQQSFVENKIKMPLILRSFYRYLIDHQSDFMGLLIKCLNITYLDICLSSILQIKYYRNDDDLAIDINYYFAYLLILPQLAIIILTLKVGFSSKWLLNNGLYQNKFGEFYVDLNVKKETYGFFIIFQYVCKLGFMYLIVYLYENPILQTSCCLVVTSLRIFPLILSNPYKTRGLWMQSGLPEICVCLIICFATSLAVHEQTNLYSKELKYNLGWAVIGIIGGSLVVQLYFIIQSFCSSIKEKARFINKHLCGC